MPDDAPQPRRNSLAGAKKRLLPRPDLFSAEIEHLAGEGLERGSLTQAQLETICGSVLNHVKQYREKIGIFKGFAPD